MLAFVSARDFENPADAGADNVYDVQVRVSDGISTDTQAIAVTVGNVNDNAPAITSNGGGASASVAVAENTTAVTTVTATDADAGATLTYAIVGGADAALFTIDPTTGVLAFVSARDFENPADAGADNVYDVQVRVSDGISTDTQAIAVTVGNVNDNAPAITSNGGGASASVAVAENATAVTTVTATDADAGATLTYAIVGGADAALFTIDPTTGVLAFVSARDFENPADAGADNVYDVQVRVSDGISTDTQAIAVTITDTNDGVSLPPVFTGSGDPNDFDVAGGAASSTVTATVISGTSESYNGTNSSDTINTGNGADNVFGHDGDDIINGQNGADLFLYGQTGADAITGGSSNDTMFGGSGNDTLYGGEPPVSPGGGSGSDTIYGGSGDDTIYGQDSSDLITGGYGADTLNGGTGDDTFVYLSLLDTGDTITDFEGAGLAGGDAINLSAIDAIPGGVNDTFAFGGTAATANAVWYSASGGNSTVYVDIDGNTSTAELAINLTGVSSLIAADFIF